MSKNTKPEKKPTDEALATLMLDRQERVQRCAQAIEAALKEERCDLVIPSLNLVDGKLIPVIQIAPKN